MLDRMALRPAVHDARDRKRERSSNGSAEQSRRIDLVDARAAVVVPESATTPDRG
jgi:hypothetical protein